jgi:transposase
MVHRWIREEHQRTLVAQAELATGAFMPLQLQAVPVANDVAQPGLTQARADTDSADIRIEVRRGTGTVTVNWPLEGAASCAAWLRDWLR